jgi:large subunit ribosomal protein L9
MALTEVLLLKPVENLGAEGDQVKVRAGFARNFLLPQNVALPVNRANRKHIESLKKARAAREAKELDVAQGVVAQLAAVNLVFAVKTGEGGKMFGAVTVSEIIAKLAEQGVEIEKKKVHLPHGSVKGLGKHVAHIKLHADVTHELEFEVVSENPIEEVKAEEPDTDSDDGRRDGRKPKREYKKRAKKSEDSSSESAPAKE